MLCLGQRHEVYIWKHKCLRVHNLFSPQRTTHLFLSDVPQRLTWMRQGRHIFPQGFGYFAPLHFTDLCLLPIHTSPGSKDWYPFALRSFLSGCSVPYTVANGTAVWCWREGFLKKSRSRTIHLSTVYSVRDEIAFLELLSRCMDLHIENQFSVLLPKY